MRTCDPPRNRSCGDCEDTRAVVLWASTRCEGPTHLWALHVLPKGDIEESFGSCAFGTGWRTEALGRFYVKSSRGQNVFVENVPETGNIGFPRRESRPGNSIRLYFNEFGAVSRFPAPYVWKA